MMLRAPSRPARAAALALAALPLVARASDPHLASVSPAGLQRGTTAELLLHGERLDDARGVLFYRPGVVVRSLAVENPATLRAVCAVAPDCPLGEHPFRVRTATGLTELRTLFVGALPVLPETEPNNDFDQPQPVPLNSTIEGVITAEDVDSFAVTATAGQRISVEVEGMRLARSMLDPHVALLDARRFEIAACDDSPLALQDPVLSIVAPADGAYVVQIREAAYGGGDSCRYRLHVGSFPRPAVAFPPGGPPGQRLALRFVGDPIGDIPAQLELPAGGADPFPVFASDALGCAPSPNYLRIAAIPVFAPAAQAASAPVSPPAPVTPIAFEGVLDTPGAAHEWPFAAARDRPLDLVVYARRLRSPLDSVLEVLDAGGKLLAANDDTDGPDSRLRFAPAADGAYRVRVRDQRGRGGPSFIYRIEIDAPRPQLSLALDRLDARQPQFLQGIAVPRGNRVAALLRVDRREVDGPVTIQAGALPAGLTLEAPELPPGQPLLPLLFEAAGDAPLDGALVELRGRLRRDAGDVVGGFVQNVPLVIAPPNETVYYQASVDRLAVAVAEPTPFRVQLVAPPGGMLRDGESELRVIVDRDPGFTADVTLRMLWNPPGISSTPKVTVSASQSEARYPLNAAADAPLAVHRVAVLAAASVAGGDRWVSSPLVDLAVGDAFVSGKLELAALERGRSGGVVCKLSRRRPFEGRAKVTLVGLPAGLSAQPVEIGNEEEQVVIPVVADAAAPVAQHSGLFCRLDVVQGGQPLWHRFAAGGAVRVDAPRAVAAAPPAAQAPPPAAATPPPPLSRLEQLRRDAARSPSTTPPAQANP